ncbi:AAA family ATPase [Flagellimonas marina]|uniref:AAA family ATPase n=1 Tax=Flagellimonas marina TaxID=1775168 RepID=A0ABV8PJ16_9FLAO
MVGAIHIDKKKNPQFDFKDANEVVSGVGHLNILVGTNNSGKSRLLRTLATNNNTVTFLAKEIDDSRSSEIRQEVYRKYNSLVSTYRNEGFVFHEEYNFTKEILDTDPTDYLRILEIVDRFPLMNKDWFRSVRSHNISHLKKAFEQLKDSILSQAKSYGDVVPSILYIPVLRGLRPVQSNSDGSSFMNTDSFILRTKFDYFRNKSEAPQMFSGLTIYDEIKKLLLGTEQERLLINEFETFLSVNIFESKITLIPKHDEDVLHIKIGDQPQYEVYNLGDGLQTIISILFPIFVRKDTEFLIFIEEPENHLHIRWQTLLIKALKKFDKHRFFITTHSSRIINDEDSSVFHCKKHNDKTIISHVVKENHRKQILNELGYLPSQILQTNYILWVEGPSDKILFKYWLSKLDSKLVEGIHYSIMFFNGENYRSFLMGENEFDLSFIRRLNQNFGIVLDSDRKKSGEKFNPRKKQIQELFEGSGNFCWLTRYREVENYIPKDIFEKAVEVAHKKIVTISGDPFEDRCTLYDKTSKPSYSPKIKLPEELFSIIQKNRDGSTKGITAKDLRQAIEEAIENTKSQNFRVNKIKIAGEVVKLKPPIKNSELNRQLQKLLTKIRMANQVVV